MRIAIHQPHYFPWLGFFDKIAKSDAFVLLDEVQFEKGSQMNRNRVLDSNGSIQFLTISSNMKGFLSQPYKDILTKNDQEWKRRQENALKNYYRKSRNADSALALFHHYLENQYHTLCEWTCASIQLSMKVLGITTPIIFQSQIDYNRGEKKSDLVLSICRALDADEYLAGMGGSIKYLNRESFQNNGIKIIFQQFEHPEYIQCNTNHFIAGLSVLDLFLNAGIEGAKQVVDKFFFLKI